jgi:hypothetical protein
MDRPTLLKKLDETLAAWERDRTWGELHLEVKAGTATLMRASVQTKLNDNPQTGGYPRARRDQS